MAKSGNDEPFTCRDSRRSVSPHGGTWRAVSGMGGKVRILSLHKIPANRHIICPVDTVWTRSGHGSPRRLTRIGAGGYTICRKAILESVSSRSEDDDVAVGVVNPSDPFAPRLVGGFLDDGCAALAQKLDGCVAVVHVHP
jgi:hypothetical protein